MNVVIYAYARGTPQEIADSIEWQLMRCRAAAGRDGHFIVGEYIDRVPLGTDAKYPAWYRVMQLAQRREYDGVMVLKPDVALHTADQFIKDYRKLLQRNVELLFSEMRPSDPKHADLVQRLRKTVYPNAARL